MKKTLATLAAAVFLAGCVPDTRPKTETMRFIKNFSGKTHAFGADEKHFYLFTDSGTYRFPFDPKYKNLELQQIMKDGRIERVPFRTTACINSEVTHFGSILGDCRDRAAYRECPIILTGDRQGKGVHELYIGEIGETSRVLNGLEHNHYYLLTNYDDSNNNKIRKDATVVLTEAQKAALIYRPLAEPLPTCKRYWYKGDEFYMRPLFKLCCG